MPVLLGNTLCYIKRICNWILSFSVIFPFIQMPLFPWFSARVWTLSSRVFFAFFLFSLFHSSVSPLLLIIDRTHFTIVSRVEIPILYKNLQNFILALCVSRFSFFFFFNVLLFIFLPIADVEKRGKFVSSNFARTNFVSPLKVSRTRKSISASFEKKSQFPRCFSLNNASGGHFC